MNKENNALATMYGIALEGALPQEEDRLEECMDILRTAFEALDIIKEKKVNVGNFIYWLKRKPRTYEDYLQDFYQEKWYLHYRDNDDDRCKFHKLTQEEYDLLREVLL